MGNIQKKCNIQKKEYSENVIIFRKKWNIQKLMIASYLPTIVRLKNLWCNGGTNNPHQSHTNFFYIHIRYPISQHVVTYITYADTPKVSAHVTRQEKVLLAQFHETQSSTDSSVAHQKLLGDSKDVCCLAIHSQHKAIGRLHKIILVNVTALTAVSLTLRFPSSLHSFCKEHMSAPWVNLWLCE